MYDFPTLFPAISNRETWLQTIQIADDNTGDLITLTDSSNNPLYQIYLEISPPRHHGGGYGGYGGYGPYSSPYYGNEGEPLIFASLADYISIIDVGTFQIQIPYTIMQKMRGGRTYDVYLRLEGSTAPGDFSLDFGVDFSIGPGNLGDARQILIGKLPIAFGGRGP
jgi:hypothetical protein